MATRFNWGWKNKVFFGLEADVPEIAGAEDQALTERQRQPGISPGLKPQIT